MPRAQVLQKRLDREGAPAGESTSAPLRTGDAALSALAAFGGIRTASSTTLAVAAAKGSSKSLVPTPTLEEQQQEVRNPKTPVQSVIGRGVPCDQPMVA